MAYGESNGHVIETPKGQVVTQIHLESPITRKQLEILFSNNR